MLNKTLENQEGIYSEIDRFSTDIKGNNLKFNSVCLSDKKLKASNKTFPHVETLFIQGVCFYLSGLDIGWCYSTPLASPDE